MWNLNRTNLGMKVLIKLVFFSFFFVLLSVEAVCEDVNIVYVHIGESLPSHLYESIRQARLMNPEDPIYLLTSEEALQEHLESLNELGIENIDAETIPKSEYHLEFLKNNRYRKRFFRLASERLLFVHDFIKDRDLQNTIHIESDVMLYVTIQDLMPRLSKCYPSIGIPFANDTAAICSIVYFKNSVASEHLAECMARHAPERINDMRLPGLLKEEKGTQVIDHLPILPPDYVNQTDHSLFRSKYCPEVNDKYVFCKNYDEFSCIFDAVTIGRYLSDLIRHRSCKGTIFSPKSFSYHWKKNEQGLHIPYLEHHGHMYKIANLHIHSKNLDLFRSDNSEPPPSRMRKKF